MGCCMQGALQETRGASSDLLETGSKGLSFEGPFSGLKKSSKTVAPQWASPVLSYPPGPTMDADAKKAVS